MPTEKQIEVAAKDDALKIVQQFGWQSNVIRDGKMIGQQLAVADAIANAFIARDKEIRRLRTALAMIAFVIRPEGRKYSIAYLNMQSEARAALEAAEKTIGE